MEKRLYILFISVIFLLCLGCSKDNNPLVSPEPEEPDTKIPGTTRILSASEAEQKLKTISADSTVFTFSSDLAANHTLKVNDVIVIPFEDGFLRKITNIETSGVNLIVHTKAAAITEALEKGTGQFSHPLGTSSIQTVSNALSGCNICIDRFLKENQTAVNVSINSVIHDQDGDTLTKSDQILLKGFFNIVPKVSGSFSVNRFAVRSADVEFSINEGINLRAEIGNVQSPVQKEKKIGTIKFNPLTVFVGNPPSALPVIISPELDLFIGAKLDVSSSSKIEITQSLSHTLGMKYENGNWTVTKSNNENMGFAPPVVGAGAKAKFYLKPELKIKIYGSPTYHLSSQLFAELEADISWTPWWQLFCGVDVSAVSRMRIFSTTLADYSNSFIQQRRLVAQAVNNPPPGAPMPASPVYGATGQSLTPLLQWNSISGATDYILQVSTNYDFRSFVFTDSTLSVTNRQISGLNYNTKYYWRVYAGNSAGWSNPSIPWTFNTVLGPPPSAPSLKLPQNGAIDQSLQPELCWYPSQLVTAYKLQVSTNDNFSSILYIDSTLTGTCKTLSGLSDSTKYYWRMYAKNTNGWSGSSEIWSFVTFPGTAPPAPILSYPPNGTGGQTTTPQLIWKASPGATSYKLEVSLDSSFNSFIFTDSTLTGTYTRLVGLYSDTMYYWRVSAKNKHGSSALSAAWSFYTGWGVSNGGRCPGTPSVTYYGKIYNTILIGNQCWLKENLDAGTMLTGNQKPNNNDVIEKYCYNDSPVYCLNGGLYTWEEAMWYIPAAGYQGICPTGWHIPTTAEFQTLINFVQGNGNALKDIGQGSNTGVGTNSSGFTAVLGGYRAFDGNFYSAGTFAGFWSSTLHPGGNAGILYLIGIDSRAALDSHSWKDALNVRCLKDN